MLVAWTPLYSSQRERILRLIGCGAALATAVVLLIAAARSDPFAVHLAALALLSTGVGVLMARTPVGRAIEIGVDARGRVTARRTAHPEEHAEDPVRCVFASPWLITLRRDAMWIPIWPDSVPSETFRRIWVHVRWTPDRTKADYPAERELRERE